MNLKKYKLGSKFSFIFKSILSPETKLLFDLFRNENYALKIAGGAVRDILMDKTPHDIDFASDATPTEMKTLFEKHKIRMISSKGESHGTITARINDKENFEITTLRKDVVTDGRHAEVQFTTDWSIDAGRRDLTINSLFLDEDGFVHDYYGGMDDIDNRIVRFVGDASKRIQEDYLRILRYFRFYGRISRHADCHLDAVLASICANAAGLDRISGERIWSELSKILSGNHAPDIYSSMNSTGVLPHIGLCSDNFVEKLARFRQFYSKLRRYDAEKATYLSLVMDNLEQVEHAHTRLKFSNMELFILRYLVYKRNDAASGDTVLLNIKDELCMWSRDKFISHSRLRKCQIEYLKLLGKSEEVIDEFENWKAPIFPVKGHNLRENWKIRGKEIGNAMAVLKNKWFESGYTMTEKELLECKQVYQN